MANELIHASVGTTMTQSEFEAVGLHVCNSQATGDLIYASSSTQLSRLGIGSTNYILSVVGGVPVWVARDIGARVYHDANQSIATASWTSLAFNSERYDTDTIHDVSTNNSRLTCKTAGKYIITGTLYFASNATGYRAVGIYLGGTTYIATSFTNAVNGDVTGMNVTTIYNLAVNDYVELQCIQDSGGNLNVVTASAFSPEFAMERIG